MERLGIPAVLLTVPDAETSAMALAPLASARPPTPDELDWAVQRLAGQNAADRAAGRQVQMLVFYVGHGAVDTEGKAYLTLQGGRLYRDTLQSKIIDPLGADLTHVIVDACRAQGVLGGRGAGDPRVLAQVQGLLDQEQLGRRPDVGIIYAESEAGRTHEWSKLHSGVFSHLLRSGLMGAADINGDGRVEYSELQAFLAASVFGVRDPQTHLEVHATAPSLAPREPLVEDAPPGPVLDIPAGFAATRVTVTDGTGLPLADLNRAPDAAVRLSLPVRSFYWLKTPQGEARLGPNPQGLPTLELQPVALSMRALKRRAWPTACSRSGLIRSFYDGFVASTGLVPVGFGGGVSTTSVSSPAPVPVDSPGLDLGVQLGQAPLGADSLASGVSVAYRWGLGLTSSASWTLGIRGGWAVTRPAPFGFSPGSTPAPIHRLSALGLAGIRRGRGHGLRFGAGGGLGGDPCFGSLPQRKALGAPTWPRPAHGLTWGLPGSSGRSGSGWRWSSTAT